MVKEVGGAKAAAVAKKEDKAKALAQAKEAKEKAAKEKSVDVAKADREKAADKLKAAKADAARAKEEAKAKLKEEKDAIAKKKKEDAATKKAEAAAAKVKEPDMVAQLDDHGQPEMVDKNKFPFEVSCSYPGCSEVRFVSKSGLLNVTMCKPHARKERRKRRVANRAAKAKGYKTIIEAALKQELFPDTFKKKHNLK